MERPILEIIQNRWSPYAFSDRTVDKEMVLTLLEAARWAPSSFNGQPWRYVVGYLGDSTHEKLAGALTEGNSWARTVPVLMLSVAKKTFDYKEKPNRHYMHDTGAASAYMFLQATAMDLHMHEMEGFSIEKVRESFGIEEPFEPVAMIAIGHPGEHASLPDKLQQAEENPRMRKKVEEIIWPTG